jgi:hypothetical protein
MYCYTEVGREYTRDELRQVVEAEAAGLTPEQWVGGDFEFDECCQTQFSAVTC